MQPEAIQIRAGNGLALEYGLSKLWFTARLHKTGPVTRDMIDKYIAQQSMGPPKRY